MVDEIHEGAQELVKRIGLPDGFLDKLWKEDDWTFLVKSSALLETAMAHVIVEYLNRPETAAFVEKLGFSQKLKLLKSAGIMLEYQKFIRHVSEIRNSIVHDIRKTSFSSDQIGPEDWNTLVKSLPHNSETTVPSYEVAGKFWKKSIWLGLIGTLAMAYAESESAAIQKKTQDLFREYGEFLLTRK